MLFGWLNLTGLLIIGLMMIPNLIFYHRTPRMENQCTWKPLRMMEQVGRYGSMAMMVFPLLVGEFGFKSEEVFVIWLFLCVVMLVAYFVFWIVYFRKPSLITALWLAILPAAIFILRGIFLRHWLLAGFGIVFAVGHIYITWYNHRPEVENK
ncbi:hypothetical protein [Oscillibacter sp. GMB15532]|uniref:hypothetical protein n=1 Tax=Oscillibacter sp. GMB15532 TaxID=3230022 RepID=UPI0034DF76E3